MDTMRQQMEAAQQQRMSQRKEKLQNEIKKIDENSTARTAPKTK